MTLQELAVEYHAAGDQLRTRLRQLRQARTETADPEARWHLERRIAMLTELLRQNNALTELLEHYYERGYWRDGKYTL